MRRLTCINRDNWAKTTSPNKNVKVYIGAPASSTAAGSGYVDIGTFASIIQQTKATYSSFGGVMFWDASQAYGMFKYWNDVMQVRLQRRSANNRFDAGVKSALSGGSSAPTTTVHTTTASTTTTSSSTASSSTPPPSTGSCAGVNAWVNNVAVSGYYQHDIGHSLIIFSTTVVTKLFMVDIFGPPSGGATVTLLEVRLYYSIRPSFTT